MRKIDQLLSEYGESHQNATNKLIHWFCVPSIFWSIMGLLWSIPNGFLVDSFDPISHPFINWCTFVLILVLIYYFGLSRPLALGMLVFTIGFLYLTHFIDVIVPMALWQVSLIVFILAWIVQFVGHKIEGKKPSFFKDVQFLLIGPAWVMSFIYTKLGFKY